MTAVLRQIDESAALFALCGDRQLLCQLAQIFAEDAPIMLRDLESSVISNDIELALRLTHSLKGLTSMFFAETSTASANRMEKELRRGASEYLRQRTDELKCSVEALVGELQTLGYIA